MANNEKTLILVNPPQQGLLEGFSNGLYAIKSYLYKYLPSLNVQMLDLGAVFTPDIEQVIKSNIIAPNKILFVGITTTTASYQNALATARLFKKLFPKCITLLGGHHAANQAELVLGHKEVDYVVVGEGEIALTELIRSYPDITETIPNLCYKNNGTIISDPPKAPLLDQRVLEEIPFIFPERNQSHTPGKFGYTTYVSSRGCTFNCGFCSVGNGGVRAKSVSKALSEITYMVRELGYHKISIEDNFFNHSPERTLKLCDGLACLKNEVDFSWDCQTRLESLLDNNVIASMDNAGCDGVYVGVEALHESLLFFLGKTAHPQEYLNNLTEFVIPNLLCTHIRPYINLQFGIPNETESEVEESICLLKHLGSMAAAAGKVITIYPQLYVLYPGTKHFKKAIEENRYGNITSKLFESFTPWELDQKPVLNWLGEHFAHGAGGFPEGIICLDTLRESGQFRIDINSVLDIMRYLERIEEIAGIKVFKYKQYLTV